MLLRFKTRASEIIREFQNNHMDFTLDEFEKKYRTDKKTTVIKVSDFFDEIADELTSIVILVQQKHIEILKILLINLKGIN